MTTKITPAQRAENRIRRLEQATAELRFTALRFADEPGVQYKHVDLCRAARDYAAAVRAVQKGGKP